MINSAGASERTTLMMKYLSRRKFITSVAASVVPSVILRAQPKAGCVLSLFVGEQKPSVTSRAKLEETGVIDLSRSPFAKLKTLPIEAVVIQEGFWSKRRKTYLTASIPSMHDELIAHGRMDNFLRLAGKSSAPQRGPVYSGSDIYKWFEAVGFALQSGDRPELKTATDAMIHDIVAVQEPGGYMNTYYVGDKVAQRMLYDTQTTGHELYCVGHMIQGAIAYYRATGDTTLLDAGIRFVDQFLLPNYGPAKNQKGIVAGHPEIEMALVELYRTTGKREYLDLAGYILHGDDRITLRPQQITYRFCGIPFTSRTKLEGHAVRSMYACCGATDYYLETGDQNYWKTLNALWEDLTAHQLYVTGGVGAREAGEAFGDAYELPNARAYGESCAAIGNMMWNWRMLAASGEARFTDVIERALYNGINSGMSLDGKTYCYRNPLAFDPSGDWRLQDGNRLKILQRTSYPWSGEINLTVSPETPSEFVVYVRIPGWSAKSVVEVNGAEVGGVKRGEYFAIRRFWSANDKIVLNLDMSTRLLKANPAVNEDRGRVAFQRGPIVFCMEHLDQSGSEHAMTLAGYTVELNATTTTRFNAELLEGVMVLSHPGAVSRSAADKGLYYSATETEKPEEKAVTLKLIPYYAWANRGPAAMQVWIPYSRA